MLADIASGEVDIADILFLVATILFVVYAVIGIPNRTANVQSILLGAGLACTAFALLVL